MNLKQWIRGKTGVLSIDVDFFTLAEELSLLARLTKGLESKAAAGANIVVREEHVDLAALISVPIAFIINFDYHMDCRLEFLHGAGSKRPPCNASVFEGLLSAGLTERYIWALPHSRYRHAGLVYASAVVSDSQLVLPRIHCVTGQYALDELLDGAEICLAFVCRSSGYGTPETDAIFEDFCRKSHSFHSVQPRVPR